MEVATCQHKERVDATEGVEIGTCVTCHQVTLYGPGLMRRVSVVTKLGRIDGRVVLPNPRARLLLSKEDKRDLRAAPKVISDKETGVIRRRRKWADRIY